MAPKRSKSDLLESPPSASPSEQSSSHEDEEDSSSEDLTPQPKPSAQKPHSSSSGSESEAESEPEATPRSVPEPVASKPVAQPATKKARSKAPTPSVAKRPAETQPGAKQSKKANQGKGDEAAEKSTARVWGEEEEVAILKGMIDYEKKIGSNPSSDIEAFHAFVKKSLHADASRSQLYDKVRRLKRKYLDNVEKVKKDGTVSSSWKTHDKKLFDLSKKIWRSDDNGITEKTRSARIANRSGSKPFASLPPSPSLVVDPAKDIQEMECEKNLTPVVNLAKDHLLDKNLGSGHVESYVMEKGLDLIKGQQRAELEERWANLHKAELKLFVERTKLILDQAKLVLAAHK